MFKKFIRQNRYSAQNSRVNRASVRVSQAQGTYFRKVIRSPRQTNFIKDQI